MAEFQEVFKHMKRMCDTYKVSCGSCRLIKEVRNKNCGTCEVYMMRYPQQAEEIIMNWAKDHPIKTNADKFKEVFGTSLSNEANDYCPVECPNYRMGKDACKNCEYNNFWKQEYKNPKGE